MQRPCRKRRQSDAGAPLRSSAVPVVRASMPRLLFSKLAAKQAMVGCVSLERQLYAERRRQRQGVTGSKHEQPGGRGKRAGPASKGSTGRPPVPPLAGHKIFHLAGTPAWSGWITPRRHAGRHSASRRRPPLHAGSRRSSWNHAAVAAAAASERVQHRLSFRQLKACSPNFHERVSALA
eukprot:363337-Chlamydomonas_euryale.AAC.3